MGIRGRVIALTMALMIIVSSTISPYVYAMGDESSVEDLHEEIEIAAESDETEEVSREHETEDSDEVDTEEENQDEHEGEDPEESDELIDEEQVQSNPLEETEEFEETGEPEEVEEKIKVSAFSLGGFSTFSIGSTFNPMIVNAIHDQTATFGVLSRGDTTLKNFHNQSSFAVFGSFYTTNMGSGNAKFQSEPLPEVDGKLVRLLAQKFGGGGGSFDFTDDFVKFADISNLNLISSGPAKVQIKGSSGNTDVISVSNHQNAVLGDFQSGISNVSQYFTDLNNKISQINQCLDGMYSLPELNKMTWSNGGLQGQLSGKINYVDLNDIAGTIWSGQLDVGASTPVVIRVPAGTTYIDDPLQVMDGKAAESAYVFWDFSKVSGGVTIDNFRGGSVYAPNADLTFNMNRSINAQIIGKNLVFNGGPGDEVHQVNMGFPLPCASGGSTPEPETTEISVEKVWVDGTESSVTINLLANGSKVDDVALTAAKNWKHTFTELPVGDSNGNVITYTIGEVEIPGYISVITGDASNGFKVTNTKEEEPVKSYAIGDYVWVDSNKDGIQDEDEAGLEGVTVELYDEEGNLVETTETNEDGYYKFDNLEEGTYKLKFILTEEQEEIYEFTKQNEGEDSSVDSDVDEEGNTVEVTLDDDNANLDKNYDGVEASEGIDPTWDAGVVKSDSVEPEKPVDPEKPEKPEGPKEPEKPEKDKRPKLPSTGEKSDLLTIGFVLLILGSSMRIFGNRKKIN